jgi:hypothetical protein
MNNKQLYEAMDGRISMSSIGNYSNEIVILGKYGIVSWMDDYWDIWITGVHDKKVLSSKKVFYLCSAIKPLVKTLDTGLNCEAIGMCTSNDAACQIAILLGARKKRISSPRQLANLKNAA